ncbi:MAG: hypothetical protein ACE5IL_08450 [Myxococcota bacterium]
MIHAPASGFRFGGSFWDDVEIEIEALDWRDFVEFLSSDRGPFEARPAFREGLRRRLAGLIRRRWSQ